MKKKAALVFFFIDYFCFIYCAAVWLGIMLPVLGVKALSSYAIAYLERLLL